MPDVKYLVMVTTNNNNKYYKMIPHGDTFTVEYGRLGQNSFQTASYPISQFNKKYREKINKGYVDRTDLIAELVEEVKPEMNDEGPQYAPIPNEIVAEIVKRLQDMAKKTKVGLNDYLEYQTEKATAEELKMQNSYFINALYKNAGSNP